ncbi:hypothetical protein ACFQ1I_46190 [Kitasatospora arboriphila]
MTHDGDDIDHRTAAQVFRAVLEQPEPEPPAVLPAVRAADGDCAPDADSHSPQEHWWRYRYWRSPPRWPYREHRACGTSSDSTPPTAATRPRSPPATAWTSSTRSRPACTPPSPPTCRPDTPQY